MMVPISPTVFQRLKRGVGLCFANDRMRLSLTWAEHDEESRQEYQRGSESLAGCSWLQFWMQHAIQSQIQSPIQFCILNYELLLDTFKCMPEVDLGASNPDGVWKSQENRLGRSLLRLRVVREEPGIEFSGSTLMLDFLGEWAWGISPKTQGNWYWFQRVLILTLM